MLEFVLDTRVYVYNVMLFAVTGYAIWKGAGPERVLAAMFLGLLVLPHRAYHYFAGAYVELVTVNVAHTVLDAVFCVAVVAFALYANRIYPLWIAGLQIIALQSHLARALAPDIAPLAYAVMQMTPMYFQLMALALGVWAHQRRLARHGPYRDWRIPIALWRNRAA